MFGVAFAAAALVGLAALVLHCRKCALPDVVPPPLRGAASEVRVCARHAVPGVSAVPEGPASGSVRTICGLDAASADRYEARNDALRSVARRRDLTSDDVALLMSYVESTNFILRVEREAALRNDVLNLLRNQEPVPDGLSALLAGMVERGGYDPAILDYCVQHLGALWPDLRDDVRRNRVRDLLVLTAHDISNPCAGTALYSLAEGIGPGKDDGLLRRLTLAACAKDANPLVRLSALQLAGERGYREALPSARAVLCGSRRDAVLDTVAAGTVGLLGDASDLKALENLRQKGGRRVRVAVDTAVARINGREGKENVK